MAYDSTRYTTHSTMKISKLRKVSDWMRLATPKSSSAPIDDMVGAQIHEVCFFSFGYPAGYVIHTAPRRFRAHFVIVMAVTLQRRGYVQVDENDRYTLTLRMLLLTTVFPPPAAGDQPSRRWKRYSIATAR